MWKALEEEGHYYLTRSANYLQLGHELARTLSPGEPNDYYDMAFSNAGYAIESFELAKEAKSNVDI